MLRCIVTVKLGALDVRAGTNVNRQPRRVPLIVCLKYTVILMFRNNFFPLTNTAFYFTVSCEKNTSKYL